MRLMTVEPETGAEVFERMLAGKWVSHDDQRKQLQSALDELYEPREELDEHFARLKRYVLGQTAEQLTLF